MSMQRMLSRKEHQESQEITTKKQWILDIFYSDVYKPMSPTSLRRYVYYVSFIDDYSCKTLIYFWKGKDEVFEMFEEFKALVKNLFEK